MLTDDMRLISVDDHLIEHPDVWTSRLPKKYWEVGPRVVESETGRQDWYYENLLASPSGLNAVAGTDLKERHVEPGRYDEMRPGCYDPKARIADLDEDGVWMQANFPSMPGFAGRKILEGNDRELGRLTIEAYNDFVIDEWCAAAPDRYIPLMIVPLWDPKLAAGEVERCAALGFKGVSFPDNPTFLNLPSLHTDHWSPFFAAVEAAGMPLCCHFGSSTVRPVVSPDAPMAASSSMFQITLMTSMCEFVFSPTFHRFPDLKVVFSEGSIGWIPYAKQRFDQIWEDYRYYPFEQGKLNTEVKPSELVDRNVFGCFIDDDFGVENIEAVGVDNVMWESDYPHSDSKWPHSRKNLAETMRNVPDDVAHKIVETNAIRVFNLDL